MYQRWILFRGTAAFWGTGLKGDQMIWPLGGSEPWQSPTVLGLHVTAPANGPPSLGLLLVSSFCVLVFYLYDVISQK